MAYKTILTVATDARLVGGIVSHAAAVARANDAHLDVLCLGVDRTQTGYYYAGANAMVLQETLDRAARAIDQDMTVFDHRLDLTARQIRKTCGDQLIQALASLLDRKLMVIVHDFACPSNGERSA